jgi:hypothetical protein
MEFFAVSEIGWLQFHAKPQFHAHLYSITGRTEGNHRRNVIKSDSAKKFFEK